MRIAQILRVACCLMAWTTTLCVAQEVRNYPGSKIDERAGRQASANGNHSQVFTTADSFEKVCGFYRAFYKEYHWPGMPPSLPSGKTVQWAFFILDGGKDLVHSKHWMKIQRPYILTIDEKADFQDVRDVTSIQVVRKDRGTQT